jgi:hypothetical protein
VWDGIFRENDKGLNLVKTTTRFAAIKPKYKISNAAFRHLPTSAQMPLPSKAHKGLFCVIFISIIPN